MNRLERIAWKLVIFQCSFFLISLFIKPIMGLDSFYYLRQMKLLREGKFPTMDCRGNWPNCYPFYISYPLLAFSFLPFDLKTCAKISCALFFILTILVAKKIFRSPYPLLALLGTPAFLHRFMIFENDLPGYLFLFLSLYFLKKRNPTLFLSSTALGIYVWRGNLILLPVALMETFPKASPLILLICLLMPLGLFTQSFVAENVPFSFENLAYFGMNWILSVPSLIYSFSFPYALTLILFLGSIRFFMVFSPFMASQVKLEKFRFSYRTLFLISLLISLPLTDLFILKLQSHEEMGRGVVEGLKPLCPANVALDDWTWGHIITYETDCNTLYDNSGYHFHIWRRMMDVMKEGDRERFEKLMEEYGIDYFIFTRTCKWEGPKFKCFKV